MILKKDNIIIDLKYAERITVEQRSILIEFSNGKSLVLEYSKVDKEDLLQICLLYTSPSPRDGLLSRMPSSA